ncbi:phytanoyl-CoA dioxygenase family protein [Granulosicoccus antarcticus]|uniref:phytanoyl-CoA dioxygenase family protein n=1 Tax=Granulosicoccus antarcticus TaxID=437505 RepID=UPI00146FBC7F|nr:phytanoyl-CoA dioxygenase family protein [Granulosicoccus antarcticus]
MSKDEPGDVLSARLLALAEQQITLCVDTSQQSDSSQYNGQSEASTFLQLFDSVDVEHRLPLLEADTLVRYRSLLKMRWPLLSTWLEAASNLPLIQHADTAQDKPTLPPDISRLLGSTLHQHFDSACKALSCLIDGSPMDVKPHEQAAMTAFMRVCTERLPSTDRMDRQLSGAIISGLLTELSTLLNHPGESRTDRRITRRRLRAGISDLLDILDVLSLQSTEHVLLYSDDYLDNRREQRARRLLETACKNNSDCTQIRLALARLHARLGNIHRSLPLLQTMLLASPDNVQIRTELASMLLHNLEFGEAIDHFKQSLEQANADQTLQLHRKLELAVELNECEVSAALDDIVPTITLTDEERFSGACDPAKLSLAAKLYQLYGTLVIHNVYSTELIEQCHEEFLNRYRRYFTNRKHSSALQIGDRRFQVSLALSGAFNNPEFYANAFMMPLMKRLLGEQVIIGSTVCATSLPGSRDQHGHKDHRALFTDTPDDEPMALPPVAVTTMIPLVSVNEDNGTTLVKKGSHRLSKRASNRLDYQAPIVPAGSCYLMDLALTHKGQGNRTEQVRPIVNMVYHRSWFVDNKNFRNQPPLQIDSVEYRQIPAEHRHLFDWAIQPGAGVNTPR